MVWTERCVKDQISDCIECHNFLLGQSFSVSRWHWSWTRQRKDEFTELRIKPKENHHQGHAIVLNSAWIRDETVVVCLFNNDYSPWIQGNDNWSSMHVFFNVNINRDYLTLHVLFSEHRWKKMIFDWWWRWNRSLFKDIFQIQRTRTNNFQPNKIKLIERSRKRKIKDEDEDEDEAIDAFSIDQWICSIVIGFRFQVQVRKKGNRLIKGHWFTERSMEPVRHLIIHPHGRVELYWYYSSYLKHVYKGVKL